jgi:hypothetical protein
MAEIVILEGPIKSGKSHLSSLLSNEGYTPVRGVASQSFSDNRFLAPEAQEILARRVLHFNEASHLPPSQRTALMLDCIEIARVQHLQAVNLARFGEKVILNRSAFSLMAFMGIAYDIGWDRKDPEIQRWSIEMAEKVREVLLENPLDRTNYFMDHVSKIILIEGSYSGYVAREREGLAGQEKREAQYVNWATKEYAVFYNKPLHILPPGSESVTIEDQLISLKTFLS